MAPDIDQRLDEINRKLQVMIENSFLAKLDMMFSVLVSLTFFGASLLLAQYNVARNVFFSGLVAFFPMLIYTLFGEAYSILTDDVTNRFAFWLVLVSSLGFLVLTLLYSTMVLILRLPDLILVVVGTMAAQGLIVMLNRYTRLFWKYMARFPTRFGDLRESYGKETRRLLIPVMFGLMIYFVAFILIIALSALLPV
ncbi:MAG TPA: hypothetical protein VJ249_09755 [Candidatus Bathyarchaeia archaeon]|nr:hypothetical protein [Candidatus Bathyarchaeia archaeon]